MIFIFQDIVIETAIENNRKLAIEVDELGHLDRNKEDEMKSQKKLEEHLKCTFFRINPDKKILIYFLSLVM